VSYDLYFKPRTGVIDLERFARYFDSRSHYKVDLPQVWYQNEDTGVYFVFELGGKAESDEDTGYPVSLNVNFFRPSYFILEAAPEITEFVRSFDLLVLDPQTEGMGEGEYKEELLISGWNHGNEFGYAAMLRDPDGETIPVSLPTSKLVAAWSWNFKRQALQSELGESTFVPQIMFLLVSGQVATAAVWPDGIPIAVAEVDYLIVPRRELAPRRFLKRVEDEALISWSEAMAILNKHSAQRSGDCLVLNYSKPPIDVVRFVQSLQKNEQKMKGVAADQVLNRELVEKYGRH
jgi:hypothetical protein